jgi:hypothetical protein
MARKKQLDIDPYPLLDRPPKVGDLLFRLSFSEPQGFGYILLVLYVSKVNKSNYEDCYYIKYWHTKKKTVNTGFMDKDISAVNYPYYALVAEI